MPRFTKRNVQFKEMRRLKNISQVILFSGMSVAIAACSGGGGVDGGAENPNTTEPPTPLTRAVDIYYAANPLKNDEVFVVSTDGMVHRNSTSASIADPSSLRPSPNGRYLASLRSIGSGIGLYVDDLTDNNEAVQISANLVANGNVASFKWSPDSQYLAYRANQETDKTVELYVMPVSGGTVVKLHPDKTSGEEVSRYEWSPDSQQIAFVANHDNPARGEVYVTNRDGSGNLKLNSDGLLLDGAAVTSLYWSPDSSRLAFRFDEIVGFEFVLYAVDPDGNNEVQLSGAGTTYGAMGWLPDSSAIIYLADQDAAGKREIYRAASDGDMSDGIGNIKLNGEIVDGNGIDIGAAASISPDGAFIAYRAGQEIANKVELYVSDIDGTSNLKLSSLEEGPTEQDVGTFRWSPDSSQIAYRADQNTPGIQDLFVAPVKGGATQMLSSNVQTGVSSVWFIWSRDGQQIAYIADQDTADVFELYVATPNIGGIIPPAYKVSDPMVAGGNVSFFTWSRDNAYLLYRADQDTDTVIEAYTVANSNTATSTKISTALAPGSTVSLARWLPTFTP